VRRRDFIALAGAAATFPQVTMAQQAARVPRVALVDGGIPVAEMQIGRDLNFSAFLDEMSKRGFVEGKSIVYDRYLSLQGVPPETSQNDARRILAASPDVIAISGNNALTQILKALNKTTPMVVGAADFLSTGIIINPAHPEANLTGWAVNASADFEGKMLSLLAQAVPGATRFAYAQSGVNGQFRPEAKTYIDSITTSADRAGLTMVPIVYAPGGGEEAWKAVMDAATKSGVEMIVFGTDRPLANNLQQASLAGLAGRQNANDRRDRVVRRIRRVARLRRKLSPGRPRTGQLCRLDPRWDETGRPPVMQPQTYDFVVNLKTARALGLTIAQSLLVQATQVIE
jgi:putative ABC transport system substrate-binding protein